MEEKKIQSGDIEQLSSLTKEEVYKLAGIELNTTTKKTTESPLQKFRMLQVKALFKNRAVGSLIKDLYSKGKSPKNIATVLNKIGKEKFGTMKVKEKGKEKIYQPKISETDVFNYVKNKTWGDKTLREKNLTKKELLLRGDSKKTEELIKKELSLPDAKRVEELKKKIIKWNDLDSPLKNKIEKFAKKDARDWDPKKIYVRILTTKMIDKNYSALMTIPLEIIQEVREINKIPNDFYTVE